MRFANIRRSVPAVALSAALVVKMVVLEPVDIGLLGMSVVLVGALLPVALLLGRNGIPIVAAACGVAHWVNHGSPAEALVASLSVAMATGLAYLVLRPTSSAPRWVAAGWIITGVLSLSMAVGQTLISGAALHEAFLTVFSRVWLTINLVGVPASFLATLPNGWGPNHYPGHSGEAREGEP
jgi:hypothetical protein